MLHTLMKSPFYSDLPLLIRLLAEGDDLLLLQDGVLAALHRSSVLASLLASPAVLYVLQEDVAARGLEAQISENVITVDYEGFVALTVKHLQQMAW